MEQEELAQTTRNKKRKCNFVAKEEKSGTHIPLLVTGREASIFKGDDPIAVCNADDDEAGKEKRPTRKGKSNVESGKKKRPTQRGKTNIETVPGNFDKLVSDKDGTWAETLSDSQLDLMVSIKQLTMERMISTRAKNLQNCFPPRALQAVGIFLEEMIKYHVKNIVASLHEVSLKGHASEKDILEKEATKQSCSVDEDFSINKENDGFTHP